MKFRRNPRLFESIQPEIWKLRPLPVTPIKQKRSPLSQLIYPLVMVLAYGAMYYFNQTSPMMLMFPLIMLVPALLVPWIDARENWKIAKENYKEEIEAYNAYLDDLEKLLKSKKEDFILWNELNFPGENNEVERCYTLDETLWNKRAEYDDFMTVSLGKYRALLPVQFEIDSEQMALCKDKTLINRVKTLLSTYKYVADSPLLVNLSSNSCLGISCKDEDKMLQDTIAGILLSAVYSYGYDELKIMAIINPEPEIAASDSKYQWIRWLPHCWDNDRKMRFFATNSGEKDQLLTYLETLCEERTCSENCVLPHILLLVEDIPAFEKHSIRKYFTEKNNSMGISIIFISDEKGLPSQCESVLTLSSTNTATFENAKMFGIAKIPLIERSIETYDIENMARYMSTIQLTDDSHANDLPEMITLFEVCGERNLEKKSIMDNWNKNYCYQDGIKAQIGMRSSTEKIVLDMSDEKDGAHMLVAGTTGSGKSEFLQTLVVSLAERYSPDEVSFVFIDFKEGGMSESFKELPHNAGSLTNIDSEIEYFASRAMTMLNIERKRRAKCLEPFGQKINNYQKAYHESGQKMEPLPHLFIVIDEFAEVISQCSDFKEMIVSLSRVGRSLGIHLILATQSPSQSVDSQIWSNSNCKICLKVLNEEESNAVLKTKDAANIRTRGRGFCLTGSRGELVEFQTAWSGAPTTKDLLDANVVLLNGLGLKTVLTKNEKRAYSSVTQLMLMLKSFCEVQRLSSISAPHTVLTSSLTNYLSLKDFDPAEQKNEVFYLGMGDFIESHIQKKVPYRFGNGNNHLLIAGTPNSGRSNIIMQMVKQMELFHTPEEIQFFIFQYGSKSLSTLSESPLVAEYVTNLVSNTTLANEKVERVLPFLSEIISSRQADSTPSNETRIVLVIDGWNQLTSTFENFSGDLLSMMSMNPAQSNVHFIITTGPEQIGYKLSPYFDSKILMKYDPSIMSSEDFAFEGKVLMKKGRGLYFDTVLAGAVELQTFDEIDITINNHSTKSSYNGKLFKIPTFEMVFANRGYVARQLYEETNGTSILLGLSNKTLEWIELSFSYHGVLVSYVDELPKNAFIQYIIDNFVRYNVQLIVEESKARFFNASMIHSNDPDYLLDWAQKLQRQSIIILDYPGISGNDCSDYSNLKKYPWQDILLEKVASNDIMILCFEHTSRAKNNSMFCDALAGYQKRIAIGGRGERHPFFDVRLDTCNVYLDRGSAFVSLDGDNSYVVRLLSGN